jgi:molybdopterin adenylyltransferase
MNPQPLTIPQEQQHLQQLQLDSLTYNSLIQHLQQRPTVQNIDIMNVAGFCRNCLSKWRHNAAHTLGIVGHTYDDALENVYGMSYNGWKNKYQTKASPEALNTFEMSKSLHANHDQFQSNPVIIPANISSPTVDSTLVLPSNECCQLPLGEVTSTTPSPSLNQSQPNTTTATTTPPIITCRILTCSDRASKGIYQDISGPKLSQLLTTQYGIQVLEIKIVPDEREEITTILQLWSSLQQQQQQQPQQQTNLIITTGGTGLSQRDVTPEATLDVIQRRIPGIPELIRRETSKIEPHAILSRAESGICNKTLIINFPGSPRAVEQCVTVIGPLLKRAIEVIKT